MGVAVIMPPLMNYKEIPPASPQSICGYDDISTMIKYGILGLPKTRSEKQAKLFNNDFENL